LTPPGSGRSTPFGYYNNNNNNNNNNTTSTSSGYGGYNSHNPSGDGRIGKGGSSILPVAHRYADDLEGQNDEAIEGLTAKVKLLKDVRTIQPLPYQNG
jgi:blocked-early-in-transport protein 1